MRNDITIAKKAVSEAMKEHRFVPHMKKVFMRSFIYYYQEELKREVAKRYIIGNMEL